MLSEQSIWESSVLEDSRTFNLITNSITSNPYIHIKLSSIIRHEVHQAVSDSIGAIVKNEFSSALKHELKQTIESVIVSSFKTKLKDVNDKVELRDTRFHSLVRYLNNKSQSRFFRILNFFASPHNL